MILHNILIHCYYHQLLQGAIFLLKNTCPSPRYLLSQPQNSPEIRSTLLEELSSLIPHFHTPLFRVNYRTINWTSPRVYSPLKALSSLAEGGSSAILVIVFFQTKQQM
uniref:Ovule protein n=1 Tax=Steinernema glaseri TaxID=37863 RepID=A0A1I7YUI7_9BILA